MANRLLNQAHLWVSRYLSSGDFAVDATLGKGFDTLFLAQQVGLGGRVFGFDIQAEAIEVSRKFLLAHDCLDRVSLILGSHANMESLLPPNVHGKIAAFMFNLGYLPGFDKRIITQQESTLEALAASRKLIAKRGIISILAYPGHPGGEIETQAVIHYCEALAGEPHFSLQVFHSESAQAHAPILLIIEKHPE